MLESDYIVGSLPLLCCSLLLLPVFFFFLQFLLRSCIFFHSISIETKCVKYSCSWFIATQKQRKNQKFNFFDRRNTEFEFNMNALCFNYYKSSVLCFECCYRHRCRRRYIALGENKLNASVHFVFGIQIDIVY